MFKHLRKGVPVLCICYSPHVLLTTPIIIILRMLAGHVCVPAECLPCQRNRVWWSLR